MMATIFGTKVNVISWICVSAWKNAMNKPTPKASAMIGPDPYRTTRYIWVSTEYVSLSLTPLPRQIGIRRTS